MKVEEFLVRRDLEHKVRDPDAEFIPVGAPAVAPSSLIEAATAERGEARANFQRCTAALADINARRASAETELQRLAMRDSLTTDEWITSLNAGRVLERTERQRADAQRAVEQAAKTLEVSERRVVQLEAAADAPRQQHLDDTNRAKFVAVHQALSGGPRR